LDTEISQTSAKYLETFVRFRRALEHRNSLLKQIRDGYASEESLDLWDGKVAGFGSVMRHMRREYVERLSNLANEHHQEFSSGAEQLAMEYTAQDGAWGEEEYLGQLRERRRQDIGAGMSTAGAQRDHLEIQINGESAAAYGSQGQQRTAVLSVKFGQAEHWRRHMGRAPILLLDDILSDLDARRRKEVLSRCSIGGQVIITTTEVSALEEEISGAKVFRVESGTVSEA
jgi:DNA replication and repair protein RecF